MGTSRCSNQQDHINTHRAWDSIPACGLSENQKINSRDSGLAYKEIETMNCDCKDWKENIDKMNAGFAVMEIHGFGGYSGKQFEFCPFCGEKLK